MQEAASPAGLSSVQRTVTLGRQQAGRGESPGHPRGTLAGTAGPRLRSPRLARAGPVCKPPREQENARREGVQEEDLSAVPHLLKT